ncbi:hypothetical protein NIES4075_48350 [Tolypothrix sp. NIES-4075]|uniref:class I SAM-dependent methyltransferase n=1 Tax=Tolypothrix sp. NIES-4075 TaxID=2005459 RepID=UPI000B5CEC06|nr:class I SAM-dependent methyltransferase [Tolypothrix sp. NIES-4075]GAX43820.1 hypothetical protein NIES4075_48350 [Tolypothrix sp. NIES-4075]
MQNSYSSAQDTITHDAAAGAASYTKQVLAIYDFLVLGFANTFAWKCPTRLILDFYNQHISNKHIDVGVGTGYFLDKCQFPSSHPIICLLDLNPNTLEVTAKRIRRYNPTTFIANVLEPLKLELTGFDSIGLNYLLHCLPGNMLSKGVVFKNLKPFLNDGGVVFGTTILGQGVPHNLIARKMTSLYNYKGIFGNINDNLEDLKTILKENFHDYSIQVIGSVAFFVGQI